MGGKYDQQGNFKKHIIALEGTGQLTDCIATASSLDKHFNIFYLFVIYVCHMTYLCYRASGPQQLGLLLKFDNIIFFVYYKGKGESLQARSYKKGCIA